MLEIIKKLAGEEIAAKVSVLSQISADVQKVCGQLKALEFEYTSKKKELNKTLQSIRDRCDCPREFLTYIPDPSGNSDSYYECQICGKMR